MTPIARYRLQGTGCKVQVTRYKFFTEYPDTRDGSIKKLSLNSLYGIIV
jgi:hypothetical protein